MVETHAFGAFVPQNSKYLILGSFTAKLTNESNYDWFYGTKRNQFWKILRNVYQLPLEELEEKKKLFSDLQLAITDIIYQCERQKGSNLDNNLINIVYHFDLIKKILEENNIETIYFSSRYVENNFKRHFKDIYSKYKNISYFTLPSPSPRYALLTLDQKTEKYKELLPKIK